MNQLLSSSEQRQADGAERKSQNPKRQPTQTPLFFSALSRLSSSSSSSSLSSAGRNGRKCASDISCRPRSRQATRRFTLPSDLCADVAAPPVPPSSSAPLLVFRAVSWKHTRSARPVYMLSPSSALLLPVALFPPPAVPSTRLLPPSSPRWDCHRTASAPSATALLSARAAERECRAPPTASALRLLPSAAPALAAKPFLPPRFRPYCLVSVPLVVHHAAPRIRHRCPRLWVYVAIMRHYKRENGQPKSLEPSEYELCMSSVAQGTYSLPRAQASA